jgi:hypothetical protein
MPELFDVWRAGAPGIDIFSPDNSNSFVVMCGKYTQSGNPLFIPEEAPGPEGAAPALYAFGHCLQLRWPLGTVVPLWQQRWSRAGIQRVTLHRYK